MTISNTEKKKKGPEDEITTQDITEKMQPH